MDCKKCGFTLNESDGYCAKCGARLDGKGKRAKANDFCKAQRVLSPILLLGALLILFVCSFFVGYKCEFFITANL